MPYEVLNNGTHECSLPDPSRFPSGAEIRCTDVVKQGGRDEVCGCQLSYAVTAIVPRKHGHTTHGPLSVSAIRGSR